MEPIVCSLVSSSCSTLTSDIYSRTTPTSMTHRFLGMSNPCLKQFHAIERLRHESSSPLTVQKHGCSNPRINRYINRVSGGGSLCSVRHLTGCIHALVVKTFSYNEYSPNKTSTKKTRTKTILRSGIVSADLNSHRKLNYLIKQTFFPIAEQHTHLTNHVQTTARSYSHHDRITYSQGVSERRLKQCAHVLPAVLLASTHSLT